MLTCLLQSTIYKFMQKHNQYRPNLINLLIRHIHDYVFELFRLNVWDEIPGNDRYKK